jgi:uncharacterized membrane protein
VVMVMVVGGISAGLLALVMYMGVPVIALVVVLALLGALMAVLVLLGVLVMVVLFCHDLYPLRCFDEKLGGFIAGFLKRYKALY